LIYLAAQYTKNGLWWTPLLPEILDQIDPIVLKNGNFYRYSHSLAYNRAQMIDEDGPLNVYCVTKVNHPLARQWCAPSL